MPENYDVITVGGGLAGSALARSLALEGKRVLVLERETQFKDRVRGENLTSWGVAELAELGLLELLRGSCAHEQVWWDIYLGPNRMQHRNLIESTPSGLPNLNFYHPQMQETLISAAADAGAEVRSGARVNDVKPGPTPAVTFEQDGHTETVEARIVVGADGRTSVVRKWGSFAPVQDPDMLQITGILMDDWGTDEDACHLAINPMTNNASVVFPQGNGRARSYLVTHAGHDGRLQGEADIEAYKRVSIANGMPADMVQKARTSGPLATFNGADSYVHHPYKDGIALIGDAAATSDPCWGQGLAVSIHDVRLLRDHLLQSDDWDAAGHAYAEAHDHDFAIVHETEDWFTRLLYSRGPEADERRMRVMPILLQDPNYLPDTFQSGPQHVTLSEDRKIEIFGA
jgi:2-polyprenyl-6-methoxyphenol hydroxylase-like FAD-dependent oxidoreductase